MEAAVASRSLTPWSILTLACAIPTWFFVGSSAVMTRDIDGGIFLSLAAGLGRGLPLYLGVWENKDPLFPVAMLAASKVSPAGPFVMDWFWISLAAFGGWLVARSLMSADRALFVGLVLIPFVMVGPFYVAGWSNTPGNALILLGLGLAMARRGVAAGVVIGLVAFTRLIEWPIGLTCLLVLVLIPTMRRVGLRALSAMLGTMVALLVALAAVGWLAPYVDALQRNRAYASDVIAYFGFDPTPVGHLTKLVGEWQTSYWIAMAVIVFSAVLFAVAWLARPSWRTPERGLIAAWLVISLVGTAGILAFTYVWPHHAQALSVPTALAVIALASLVPVRWPYLAWLGLVVLATWAASGVGNPTVMTERFQAARDGFATKWSEISEVPTDARLLNSVPLRTFRFARLGTNDDRGFLASVRDGATLGCAQFHLYDFSPPSDFARMLDCLKTVDVVIKTDNFVVFGNGGRAASVQPILQYVDFAFDCLRIGDRQLCTRKPG
jgi:hypothetical protein